jgi:hypothetical protein
MKQIAMIAVSAICLFAVGSFAGDSPKANPYTETLSSVPAAELPAKAAELVRDAKARQRETVTIEVVKAAVAKNPGAAPAIVGTIAKAAPDMAAVAAATAAAEQPAQASAIAKAAAAAAPSKAGKIVAAVCRVVPNEYRNIAVAVAEVVPTSAKDILKGVEVARPDLKPGIESAMSNYVAGVSTVGDMLDAARTVVAQASSGTASSGQAMPRGPAVGPPYLPLSGTPSTITPSTSGDVPSGGRNYSSP